MKLTSNEDEVRADAQWKEENETSEGGRPTEVKDGVSDLHANDAQRQKEEHQRQQNNP